METESTGHYEVRCVHFGMPGFASNPIPPAFRGPSQWEIHNFAKLTQADRQTSETFEIGTYLWCVSTMLASVVWRFGQKPAGGGGAGAVGKVQRGGEGGALKGGSAEVNT